MQFRSALTILTSIACLASTALAKAIFNDQLKVYDMGQIPSEPGQPDVPAIRPCPCGGIPPGGWACGSFVDAGVNAMRAVYQCDHGEMVKQRFCKEEPGFPYRCVKNSRHDHKKFDLSESEDAIVCRLKSEVEKP